jgi:hypothetical protein
MKAPASAGAFLSKPLKLPTLKYRDVFQQRDDAENDDDDARNLLGAAIERQQIDQIEDQNNDQKRNERADNHRKPPEDD